MGRDDDSADAPRRASLAAASGGGGSGARSKRNPGTSNSGLKYDPAMAASQQHVHHMHHHPHDQHHAVYAPPSEYTAGGAYAMPYTHEEAPSGSANNKRKRVKKERDDDWAPMPPPAPSSSSMVYASGANDMPMHMAVPTILHRSGSAGTVTTAPPPYEAAYTSHSETNNGPAHTIFSEAPVVIESFTEIERRKAAAAAAPSASASSTGADLSQLLHADQPASATSTPKNKANGVALWNGRGVSSGTMSVYDVFFPATTRLKEGGSNSKNGVRESKRRRRNNGDAAERSSTRASHRRTAPADDSLEVDMLRFTVDSFKLIPQGLVDRIDTRLRPSVVATLIANHVENWIKRAGFDDQNFLQEITTLLNVYYPCSHPTILDDVLVAFVFKRPELMERMITKSIIERLQKAGESATPSKYPIIESFARRCSMAQRGGIRRRDVARHDLACLTVLRLLLERNTEKFMLSSWIASCASCCSDVVLSSMWTALLRPLIPTGGKLQAECWNVRDPLDQVFELLREEKQLARYADGDTCKLSMTLITKIVQDPVYSDLRGTPVACEAFEIFFGRPTNSSRLIETWIATEEERDKISREDALRKVMNVTIEHCARLSVKKTNWFIRHVLGFVLGASTQWIFGELIVDHAGLLLGGVDKNEMEEAQGLANEVCEGENGKSSSKGVVVIGNVSSNEKNAEAGVVVQLGVFLDALRSVPEKDGVPVVHAWADKWCIPEVFVPWSYIWAVVSSAITMEVSESTVSPSVNVAFRDFACQLAKHYVANLLRREEAARYLPRVTRILNATIQQLPKGSSVSLLESVLVAVSSLSKSSPLAEKAYNIIAATLARQISTRRQAVRGVIVESMGQRVALLHTVDSFVSRQDPVGRLVRDQLIRRRRIGKIILEVLQDGDEVEAGAAVKIMMSAVGGGLECQSEGSGFWATSTIEAIVALGYRVRLPGTRRGAISLLHALSVGGGVSKQSLLWTVLRLCTNYCCGCSTESSAVQATNSARVQVYDAAFEFADLTKLMLQRAPRDMFADVGDFIHQQIRSCGPSKAQWNYYLVLVLDRVVQLGWSLMASSPKLVHVVLTPFDSVYPVARLQDQIVQLRVLKSLCVVLLAASSNQQTARKDASWLPVARTLVSNPLALKIKAISAQRGCLTSSVLAQSIAVLCEDIKQTIEVKGYF